MKKYSRICLLFCFLFLWHNRIVYADDTEIRIMVNQQEKTLTWKPMLFENDVMIALEDFGRILEADVVWDETGQRFAIGYNGCILMEDIANETEVVWNDDGETCFPLQGIKKCFYLKKQDQFFVSIRSLGELLGIENFYDETEQVVYLTCSSAGENKVTSEDILCMDMQRYVWKNQGEQFDTASEDMQEFYDQRISWMDAVAMGSSDIWEGVKDLASPMTNAEDRIKDSLETVLASLPENDFVAVDHELYDFLKDAVMNVNATTDELLGIEQQLLEIIPKLKPLKESIKNLDDVIGDMSLLYDVTASSLDAVAILLSNYEKNIGYLDVLESALQESNRLDETLKNSIVVLREEYTNKFAQLFFKTRDDLTKFTISNIADVATGGVFSIGEFAWKAFFGAIGINSKGEALKLFYGLLYMNGSLDTAYKNQYVIVQELESNQEEAEKLRQLDDLQRAVKKNMYQCIRTVTNDKDTQEYCKIKEKEYSESCLSWDKVVYITEGRSGGEIEDLKGAGVADETAGGIIFEELPESFIFTSGMGSWSTQLSIDSDGNFFGNYTNTDMGVFGEEYPNGTEYFCNFNGKFAVQQKTDKYSYRISVEYLYTEEDKGVTYYENGIRYIASAPYGLENVREIFLYLPGYPIDQMPEEAFSWINSLHSLQEVEELPPECYVLYNVQEGIAFLGLKEEEEFLIK